MQESRQRRDHDGATSVPWTISTAEDVPLVALPVCQILRCSLCVSAPFTLFLEEALRPLRYRRRQKRSNLPRVNTQLARGTARMWSQVSQLSQPKLSVSSILLLEETWNLKGDCNWHNNSLFVMKGTWLMTEEPVAPSITFLVIEAGHSVSCQQPRLGVSLPHY